MNSINFPLNWGVRGLAVADLQDALQLCLDRHAVVVVDDVSGRELSAALKRERVEQMYGDATARMVGIFQRERRLEPRGEVDDATANAFNALLKEWGLLDQPPAALAPALAVYASLSLTGASVEMCS